MARILDAQRLAEAKHLAPGEDGPTADSSNGGGQAEAEPISFIEVGGPINGVQASADVLACPSTNARKPRLESRPAPALTPAQPARPVLSEAGPLFVAFQPWPEAPAAPFPELVSFHRPDHPASDLYRTLLGQILSGEEHGHPQALLFTGLTPGVGTTTALLNLAVCAAREGKRRVAVLDLNASRPAVAKRLGVSSGPWIDEILSGRGGLEKALQPTRVGGLFVLAPDARGDRASVASAEAARWILSWLRQRFDLIFIDASPWEDQTSLALGDAAYLVAPAGGPSAARLSHVAREIARQGGRLRGILQTGIES
jgi:Mrp family chromosome partitioning ATPase